MAARARKKGTPTSSNDKGLTEERIVAAALELIDAAGLSNFSLRDVARSLDVYPTAVYWYVKSRDDLATSKRMQQQFAIPFGNRKLHRDTPNRDETRTRIRAITRD